VVGRKFIFLTTKLHEISRKRFVIIRENSWIKIVTVLENSADILLMFQ
jgi:hypothetical protein